MPEPMKPHLEHPEPQILPTGPHPKRNPVSTLPPPYRCPHPVPQEREQGAEQGRNKPATSAPATAIPLAWRPAVPPPMLQVITPSGRVPAKRVMVLIPGPNSSENRTRNR